MKPAVRKLLRETAKTVIGDRADAAYVTPVLLAMLSTAVRDFETYFDARQASNRVRDIDILLARNRAAAQKAKQPA